jgi:NTP pyrophosphatase (non-canonical NTP hydrolase)
MAVTLSELADRVRDFARKRDWEQFHNPKNLSMALAGEVGEVLAVLQWLAPDEADAVMDDPERAAALRGELADVFLYLLRLADVLGIDLVDAALLKLAENDRRYDAVTYRGSARKAPPLG